MELLGLGLNRRPSPYKGDALPLSYRSNYTNKALVGVDGFEPSLEVYKTPSLTN